MIKDDNNGNSPTSVKGTENNDDSNGPDVHNIDKTTEIMFLFEFSDFN